MARSTDTDATPANLKRAALGWLGRREFSIKGMRERIYRRFSDAEPDDVDHTIEWLLEQNYLNDERFGGMLFRYRVGRGQGKIRVRQALRQEGLSADLIEKLFDEAEVDWFEHALDIHQRRFENRPFTDDKEKARQLRFLQYRGFSADECFAALEAHEQRLKEGCD